VYSGLVVKPVGNRPLGDIGLGMSDNIRKYLWEDGGV